MTLETQFDRLSAEEISQLRQSSLVSDVEHHASLDSTNSRAMQLASDSAVTTPLLVIADAQTAGRGRGSNRWWSTAGALTFSVLCDRPDKVSACTRISLTTGIAVCEAIHQLCPGLDAALKWPNDVYVGGQKICGILVEAPPKSTGRLVVGCGVNVNNSLAGAPSDIRAVATSLFDVVGYRFPLIQVLSTILAQVSVQFETLDRSPGGLQRQWDTYCMLTDCEVDVVAGSQQTTGICRGIDGSGALRVETLQGLQLCASGQVTRWDIKR